MHREHILSIERKSKYRVMSDSTKGNQLITVMTGKEVLLNKILNGIYYYDTEDCDLVLVKTVEQNR